MKAGFLALAPLSALLISAAPPQDAASSGDFQCLIASFGVAGLEDKEAAEGGKIMSIYFLGKIDGRFPGFDLEPAVKAAAERLTEAEFPALITKCADEFAKRGEYLVAMGQRLGAESKK